MRLRSKYSFFSLTALMGLVVLMSYVIGAKKNQKKLGGELPVKPTKKVIMDDTEWKEKLTPEQYRILRKAGTERPYGEVYSTFKKQGSGKYACAGCDTELFSSNEKFDSKDFIQFCASKGRVEYKDKFYTLLLAPLQNFYLKPNRGKTQLRIAMVESPSHIKKIPKILKKLFYTYFR